MSRQMNKTWAYRNHSASLYLDSCKTRLGKFRIKHTQVGFKLIGRLSCSVKEALTTNYIGV